MVRDMAIANGGTGALDYKLFRNNLQDPEYSDQQSGPLKMRIELLESFLDVPTGLTKLQLSPKPGGNQNFGKPRNVGAGKDEVLWKKHQPGKDSLKGRSGELTIIDLTDPTIDADVACALFNICLSVFIKQTKCGKVVALDEAHKYMTETSSSSKAFTKRLLETVREQRHAATRVIIATQEPTINTDLLSLCTLQMVHRCSSPEWFAVLKKRLGSLFVNGDGGQALDSSTSTSDRNLFKQIMELELGECLLFSPTSAICVNDGNVIRMNSDFCKFKSRKRLTADGGMTKTATA